MACMGNFIIILQFVKFIGTLKFVLQSQIAHTGRRNEELVTVPLKVEEQGLLL